ncbi:hypothetical protein [Kitasatospora sp. NBC_01266]|uniref:hypothetical protein n=1 Tax=Kitasatospora sp. NBC_01266 TaxID=2903572 RepID=UPI002E30138D|nr:hypothetical protein [Kitasatospora sp. NBC_01266]
MTTPIGDIPASSIIPALTWLLTGLQANIPADPAADGLLICLGEPGPYQPQDIVYIGDIHQTYAPAATVGSGGPQWLREDYPITVTVDCYRGGDDQLTVLTRARTIADLVVATVRSDPSLGGAVDRARPAAAAHTFGWAQADEEHTAAGRRAEIVLTIDCLKTL